MPPEPDALSKAELYRGVLYVQEVILPFALFQTRYRAKQVSSMFVGLEYCLVCIFFDIFAQYSFVQ